MFKTFAVAALIAVASAGSHNCNTNSRKGFCAQYNCEDGFVSKYCGSGGCYCVKGKKPASQNADSDDSDEEY